MPRIILVHGGCHGAWCWEHLLRFLPSAIAVDLPEYGDGAHEIISRIDGSAILVGHSLGGMAISAAAELAPDRVAGLVYLSALLPVDGEAAATMAIPPLGIEVATRMEGEWCVLDPALSANLLYHDCPKVIRDAALQRIGRTHMSRITSAARLSPSRFGAVPKIYVHCENDRAIEIDAQHLMVNRYSGLGRVSLPTGHSPFLSEPESLARLLSTVI